MNLEKDKELIDSKKIICEKIIEETIKDLLMNYKFLDLALSTFEIVDNKNIDTKYKMIANDGKNIYYDCDYLIDNYKNSNSLSELYQYNINRMIMHSLLHCIFIHHKMIASDIINNKIWDLACDICVEYIIDDLDNVIFDKNKQLAISKRTNIYLQIKKQLKVLYDNSNFLVKNMYSYLLTLDKELIKLYHDTFTVDEHINWEYHQDNSLVNKNNEQKVALKIANYIKTGIELKEKSKSNHLSELQKQIKVFTTPKVNYKNFLRRFMEYVEVLEVDVDSFDPIYYVLGLNLYKNMPLIEYNEVKEEYQIADLVLIIDTSASTFGSLVQKFISQTWQIINELITDSNKIHLHIIQADLDVKDYKLIKSKDEFNKYIDNFTVYGGGGTDFCRPLEYVQNLKEQMVFKKLKGVIYFTDGYGVFPKTSLGFETVFVFCIDEEYITNEISVPSWAMKLVVTKNEIMEEK